MTTTTTKQQNDERRVQKCTFEATQCDQMISKWFVQYLAIFQQSKYAKQHYNVTHCAQNCAN